MVSTTFVLWVTFPSVAVSFSVKVPWFTLFDEFNVIVVVAVPFTTTLVVFAVQVEFTGAPLQVRIAAPVSPPNGVITIEYVAECPDEIVCGVGPAVIVKSCTRSVKFCVMLDTTLVAFIVKE
jgi:hypothetical protein